MNLNTIKINGHEFVLIPMANYKHKKRQIDKLISATKNHDDYVPFLLEDAFDHPVVLARVRAGITQSQLAKLMGVTQAYISQIEKRKSVSNALLRKIKVALKNYPDIWDGNA